MSIIADALVYGNDQPLTPELGCKKAATCHTWIMRPDIYMNVVLEMVRMLFKAVCALTACKCTLHTESHTKGHNSIAIYASSLHLKQCTLSCDESPQQNNI